jgi:uncharacterized protein DUF4367
MTKHLTDGELRAALDGQLDALQHAHLASCSDCQSRRRILETQRDQTALRLAFLAPAADDPAPLARTAWSRLSQRLSTPKETSVFKKLFAYPVVRYGALAVLLLALILAIPQTRAAAGRLLQLFRVEQVTVLPVDYTGLQQLTGNDAIGTQISQLISSSAHVIKQPGDPVRAADAAEASQLAGFSVRLPQNGGPSQIYVLGSGAFTLTVDRVKAQALLDESGRSDLVLPESVDGAKISVSVPASVSAGYGTCPKPGTEGSDDDESMIPGRRFPDCVILSQIPSPVVHAPRDLDVAQLAEIGLEFTGMSRAQAAAFASTVDWTSTLVVPIPKNAAIYEQIAVDGTTGTLIQRPSDDSPQFALMWVKDGIIYTISGLGTSSERAIEMANSMP